MEGKIKKLEYVPFFCTPGGDFMILSPCYAGANPILKKKTVKGQIFKLRASYLFAVVKHFGTYLSVHNIFSCCHHTYMYVYAIYICVKSKFSIHWIK